MELINQLVQAFLAAHDTRAQVLQSDFFKMVKKKKIKKHYSLAFMKENSQTRPL